MEYILKIDTSVKSANELIDYLKSLSFVKIESKKKLVATNNLLDAINEANKDDVTKIDGKDELSKILKDA